MAVTTKKSLQFLAGGIVAALVVAYAAGAFNPLFKRGPETITALPEGGTADSKDGRLPGAGEPAAPPEAAQAPAPQAAAPAEPAAPETAPAAAGTAAEPGVVAPSFDVVRLESNGAIVIAGKAAPNAKVDLLVGSNVIGSAMSGAEGDFAVVLEDPLKPGDYQIVLRSTTPENVVAMSVETAVVSVPETPDGQVLALVEEPGKPAQMITLPKPEAPAAAAKPAETAPAPSAAAPEAPAEPPAQQQAALPKPAEPAPQPAPASPVVRVEAVEIDGRKIFVAGIAEPGRTVRGYANEILLGDAKASPDGRFLIEADRDLPVGDYIIRIDALEPDGVKVAARAAVPFEREPGETIAAVAAPEPPAQKPSEAPATTGAEGVPAAAATAPAGEAAPSTAQTQPPAASTEISGEPAAPAEAPVATGTQPAQPAETASNAPAAEAPAETTEQGRNAQAKAPAAAGATAPEQQAAAEAPAATQQTAPTAGETPAAAASTEQPAAPSPPVTAQTQPAPETPAAEAPAAPAEPSSAPAVTAAEPPATGPATAPAEAEAPATPGAVPQAETSPAASPPAAVEPQANVAAAPQEPALPSPPSAAGVAEVLAPKLQSVDSAVIIRRGDTLWRISRRVYGRGIRYSTIYLANQTQIEDPDRIWPGQVFTVPEKSNDGKADADYSTLGNRLTTVPASEGAEPAQSQQ